MWGAPRLCNGEWAASMIKFVRATIGRLSFCILFAIFAARKVIIDFQHNRQ